MSQPSPHDLQAIIAAEVQKILGVNPTAKPDDVVVDVTVQAPLPTENFDEALAKVDPNDSEAALSMLDHLLRTGRLNRVGVLDGGQGYLFVYAEPQGSTKAGYRPGGTQGDRIVDEAVEQQRKADTKPVLRGVCPHCYSAVYVDQALSDAGLDAILLDEDDATDRDRCAASPDGLHHMA